MRTRWLVAVIEILLALAAPRSAVAQCDSCRVAILSLTAGAQPIGLGGAYVAGDGPNALFYNPAQVGSNHGSALTLERIGSATLAEFATTASTGRFSFGTGIRFLSRSDNTVPNDSAGLRGGALVAGVALATQVHGVWLGGTANFVTPDLGVEGGGAVFDVGASMRQFGLRIGLSAQNLGRDLHEAGVRQELPTRVSLGASLPATSISTYFDFAASAALSWERGSGLVPKGGVELTYEPVSGWTFTGRAGVQRVVSRPGELRQSAISLGGSFGVNAWSIDYAFQPGVAGGPAVQSLGIRVQ
jgi:hypothetical protein